MLVKCKRALLLSNVESFSNIYRRLAEEADVELTVESEWLEKQRVTQDVVILGSKYLPKLHKMYYPSAVLILKADEKPYQYIKEGITRFIYDYQNETELTMAFFKAEAITVHSGSLDLARIIKESQLSIFQAGAYDFRFDKDKYFYKGKPIYLANAQKRYLAEWLLNGHKDNKKRMLLCTLRKKFGADFLSDVNRFGALKEEKDE